MKKLTSIVACAALAAIQGCASGGDAAANATAEEVASGQDSLTNAKLDISSDWGSGYCALVTISNGLTQATTRWQAILDLKGGSVTNAWNAAFSSTSGKPTATPMNYNTAIAAGASTSFGFCANAPSSSARPLILAWNMESNAYATCATNSGLFPAKAALAVAMATELGRWDPDDDLTINQGRVALSSTGLGHCSNGCMNTKAILGQQDPAITQYVDQSVFNPTNFSADLQASFGRQANLIANLARNSPQLLPPAHKLTRVGGPTNLGIGACGPHYIFQVDNLNGSPLTSAQAANMTNALCFYGYNCGGNPYLGFTQTGQGCPSGRTCVAIDPTDGDNGSTSTTSAGSAPTYPMNRVYDPINLLLSTQCITTAGKVGLLSSKCLFTPSTCGYLYCIASLF